MLRNNVYFPDLIKPIYFINKTIYVHGQVFLPMYTFFMIQPHNGGKPRYTNLMSELLVLTHTLPLRK